MAGQHCAKHCRIDTTVPRPLEAAAAFAPLHKPAAQALVRLAQAHCPDVPQASFFDTRFHVGLPDVARVLPIAKNLQSEGIQRCGFHGLSLESIVRQLGEALPQRLLVAHPGNGASITTVKSGLSIDSGMGMTPSGGVIVCTRSGDLDPGVLVYLVRAHKFDAAMLETLVDQHFGVLEISRLSGDMRRLHEAAASNRDARLAIGMLCYSLRKQVAAMSAVLGELDRLDFTGGIKENDAQARAETGAGLAWIGVNLDDARNRAASNPFSLSRKCGFATFLDPRGGWPAAADPGALIRDGATRCQVLVSASQEDKQIARHARTFLR